MRVTPRAGRTGIGGVRASALVVRLAAAPVDGAANDALMACLADACDVPLRAVRLLSGERGRSKRVAIDGLSMDAAERALGLGRGPDQD